MNNLEIDFILKNHFRTKRIFTKTVPCNSIVNSKKYPYAIIMNTDDSKKPGVHWTAIFVNSKFSAEYFDSYGQIPNRCIAKYLAKFQNVKLNRSSIQSTFSKACGHFCCLFIILRSNGMSFENVIKYFQRMGPERDKYVECCIQKIKMNL